MEKSFNCLLLRNTETINFPITIFKNENNDEKFFIFTIFNNYHKVYLNVLTVMILKDYICNKFNIADYKVNLWKVNIDEEEIKNDFTEDDIKNKLKGIQMKPQKLFSEYFEDELDNTIEFSVNNIHIFAIIPATTEYYQKNINRSISALYEKDIDAIIGDLRKTFPHVDDVDEPFFRELAQKLAVIWKRSHDFSLEIPNNPYVKLKQNPSIFKTRLPYGITKTTCNKIDCRLPPFEANTEMIYENPLYRDQQFRDTVNLVRKKIKEYKGDVIVLAGVSGGGKTSTTFAIAAEHWGIHVDCSYLISDYNNQLSSELCEIKADSPPFDNVRLQELALRKLDIAFASRVLILIKMIVEKKIKTPKDWLLAQLYGLNSGSIYLISQSLSELRGDEFSSLISFINKCLKIKRILFIQDEAQCLCRSEFGSYTGSSKADAKPWNLLQAYTHHMISHKVEVTHIIAGTTMHMSTELALATSVGKFKQKPNVYLVLKLPYLSPDDVKRVLNKVINMDGVSSETLSNLGNILKGRPQNCASFVNLLTDRPELLKDKDGEMFKTSMRWFKEIQLSMVNYLYNTMSIGEVNPAYAVINVICCQIINSKSAGAELLWHGILPVKSPPSITLVPRLIDTFSFEINLELESYIDKSIEKYLKLYNDETLTDAYVKLVLQGLGSSQSIGRIFSAVFASVIIEKNGCNVLEELKRWTDDQHFDFPEWITPGMQFVTEAILSNSVSLYDYVEDKSSKYYNQAIQPSHLAGSDLVLSLVDKSDESKNRILLSLSSAIYKKGVPRDKIEKQAIKACLEFQYMEERDVIFQKLQKTSLYKRFNDNRESGPQSKKTKLDRSVVVGLTKKFEDDVTTLPTNIYDAANIGDAATKVVQSKPLNTNNIIYDDKQDRNFDLCYDETLESYRISKKPELAELHHKIAGLMSINKIGKIGSNERKCIHILVELPHRTSTPRPDTFRYDKNGNLIVIIDDRNVKQVFGEKIANTIIEATK